ncbi:unnamed protein product [Periconia digitata]|uniref:Uncharacterized protein n=1 Tax=Periconia digitata TaxID=1303443 RepID=A0A9W4U5R1_9PLEO|nr:unnamed protein product [Periconia digitata]
MSASTTITLITGPNRGIGHGILATLLARPNNTLIAAVRDPEAPLSKALNDLPKGEGSSLILIKIDQSVPTDAAAAIKSLDGIDRIDTLVANAAMADLCVSVMETPAEDVRRHMDINLLGVLTLFQAAEPLLKKSTKAKLVVLSSALGSATLCTAMPGPWFCYGVTKAALNYLVRRIHVEHDWLAATVLQPGWVQTDMGTLAAKSIGMESAPMKLEDSVAGCVRVVDAVSREKYNGEWVDSEEKPVPW